MPIATAASIQVILRVQDPPPGVVFAVQRGRSGLLMPFEQRSGSPAFSFMLGLAPGKEGHAFDFRGEFAQGPVADRFVYVNSGVRAGQALSCWDRRAKLKLGGIDPQIIQSALDDPTRAVLAVMRGVAPDGGPICATVPPAAVRWGLVGGAA